MIGQILKTTFLSLGIGLIVQLGQTWLQGDYFTGFLKANLINLIAALLAINCATLGIVLTKIRDLVDRHGHADAFNSAKRQMQLSIKEQVGLIAMAVLLLTAIDSPHVKRVEHLPLLLNAALAAVFVYAILVLYDTAKSVFVILDFRDK
jgi:hypothetical protein